MAADALRRVFDCVGALGGLLLLSPLFLVAALLIRLDSSGPVFYKARRVGRNGRIFLVYKFRTMVLDADRLGAGITARGDTRITRVGRILRRFKIDELPQFYNVALGEMSLVGPRPEDPRYVATYTAEQREILRAKPGITSAASLAYRNEEAILTGPDWERTYREMVLPDKLRIDLEYLQRRTLTSDLELMVRTLAKISSIYS